MNVNITQSTGTQEIINSGIIDKLYQFATDSNNTVTLSGNLYSAKGYKMKMDYLNTTYNPNLIINIPQSGQYISFIDPELQRICVQYYSSDGVGCVQSELNQITSISRYTNNFGAALCGDNSITTTKDLLNFKNLTSLGSDAFFQCSNLQDVYVPKTVTRFGSQCFYQCRNIQKIVIEDFDSYCNITENRFDKDECCPNAQLMLLNEDGTETSLSSINITKDLQASGLFNCKNVKNVVFSGNASYVKEGTFDGGGVESVDLGPVTQIQNNAFRNNSSLYQIDLSNITSIGSNAFKGCTTLHGELNLHNLTQIGQSAFAGCNQLTAVSNLGTITELPNDAISGNNITSIVLPTTIRTFGINCISRTHCSQLIFPYGVTTTSTDTLISQSLGSSIRYCQFPSTLQTFHAGNLFRDSGNNINCAFVIQATTPPSISDYSSSNNSFGYGRPSLANWYVPDSVLQTYKTATGWSQFASKIYPISQLETDSPTYWAVYQANKDYGVPAQS